MSSQLVSIAGTDMRVIEYRDQRVVTLNMMDVVHERPQGTAKRNFKQHQDKFIQSKDYEILADKELGDFLVLFASTKNVLAKSDNPSKVRSLIVLYPMGYLMLVKSFRDDLAWQVQRELVDVYFGLAKSPSQANTPQTQEMVAHTKATAEFLDKFCIAGNAKTIALNNSLKKEFGYDALKEWGLTYLTAEVQQQLLTVSDIAKRLDLKTREINPLLIAEGLQTAYRDHKNRVYYELTDKGMTYAVYQDTGKKHKTTGEPVRSIKWYESVTGLLG